MPSHSGDLGISRRDLLGGAAAACTLAALGAAPAWAAPHGGDADAIVVGAGLAGLVATSELVAAGRRVLLLDQEPEASLGGQAFWSLGGLFLVGSVEQKVAGIRDSFELARADWFRTAGFDRGVDDPLGEDHWAARWAEAYLHFAAEEKQAWLFREGMRWVPIVGWAERGEGPDTPGNSVPRFHITLGTGPGVVEPFERKVRQAPARLLTFAFRHRVDELVTTGGAVSGVRGALLEPSTAARGTPSSRTEVGEFELRAPIVIVTSGGIGANHDLVRRNWPARLGAPPARLITGVPAHVDGRMLGITEAAGARLVNRDRMWHYTEGIANHSPIWPDHGIRVLAAPSSMWFDATGQRFPSPGIPSVDTLGTLELIAATGHDYSWFVLNKRIVDKEFVLSGSEQNPELTAKDLIGYLAMRAFNDTPPPVRAFLDRGADFVVADTLPELVAGMNRLAGTDLVALDRLHAQIGARDDEIDNPASTDPGIVALRRSRAYIGDSLARTTEPHRLLDPAAGPLIAIRMNILTRKTLGGLQTDLAGRVLDSAGAPIPGLYAAGEAAGFGGGGVHGYRALEGTFLGGCLFSGREAGRAAARASA
ncbi:FAD-binding dehydrogenase [Nocardia sp. NPDC057353]|uniref:FAD-binding dehydrogenase n=1 Tax=Nocardia sp. NPDC057353 TaxID=3346104 RepID=UPI003628EA5D